MAKKDGIEIGKYGLNPVIPICFWCGKDREEIALMGKVKDEDGREIEMPMHACIDFEPCDECREEMSKGFTLMEATPEPNAATNRPMQNGVYPTGIWCVIKPEAAERIFAGMDTSKGKAFIEPEAFEQLFGVRE